MREPMSATDRICYTLAFAGLMALAALAGCSSWKGRVGEATYHEVVMELGPPDKTEMMLDGSRICSWFLGTRSGGSHYTNQYGWGGSNRWTSDRYHIMQFDASGRLIAYNKRK